MSSEALKEMVDTAFKVCEQVLNEKQIMPTVVGENATGARFILGLPWRDGEEREVMLAFATVQLKEHDAVRYCVYSETWMAPLESEGENAGKQPRERGDRVEGVMAVAVERETGEVLARAAEIKRGETGKRVLSDPFEMEATGGDLTRLFDPDKCETVH